MKNIALLFSTLVLGCATLAAQELPPAPAAIIGHLADGTVPPPPAPKPLPHYTVLRSHQQSMQVEQPPPLPGMSATTHTIKTTIEIVKRPPPAPAPPPPAPRPPLDDAAKARFAATRAAYRRIEFGFLSATVYDHQRTLLRWQPNGRAGQEITAWSNLDWNEFGGLSSFTWNNRNFSIFMAIGNETTAGRARWTQRTGRVWQPPVSPVLPTDRPAFIVTQGDATDPATTDLITGLHALYQTEGARLQAARLSREAARREYEANIRAHPPIPADIIIRCYPCEFPAKRQPVTPAPTEGGGQ